MNESASCARQAEIERILQQTDRAFKIFLFCWLLICGLLLAAICLTY